MPHIPRDAPFNYDQRSWLDGYIAGLNSQRFFSGNQKQSSVDTKTMNILYGTQTGNSEELANDAATLASERGFQPQVNELDSIETKALAEMEHAVFVVSTYGEGEMPDNANIFWEALSAETAPRLETLNYAVLALGDTSYDEFCQAGKLIDIRLEQLGAKRIAQRLECDVDYEEPAAVWLDKNIPVVRKSSENTSHIQNKNEVKSTKSKWTRRNPFVANVLENSLLSGKGSAKEIRHISFNLAESGIKYETGDALGIIPKNNSDLVEQLLSRINCNFDDVVKDSEQCLGQMLTTSFEISTPSRDFVDKLAHRVNNKELELALGNKDKLNQFLWGKDILDLLSLDMDFNIEPEEFISWLKPLQYRAYSISSSPKFVANEIHLTVAAVRWEFNSRIHKGVASTFLADLTAQDSAGIFLSPNKNFRPPDREDAPMIMVGPGTGIAPFRAFLQERKATGASGMNWLFFGDQHRDCDFLYKDELEEMKKSGFLDRLDLAFSRDQKEKVYVQNIMAQQGKKLFDALENGAYFYICGDASKMAKDVDKALHDVIKEHGALTLDKTNEYVKNLKLEKRYLRDVY